MTLNEDIIKERRKIITDIHKQQRQQWDKDEEFCEDVITPEYLTACIREIIDEDTIILNEGISNYETIYRHIKATKPGTIIGSGAGSLGWHGGAAIGAKLAAKEKTIISLTGDGSYMFSIPATVKVDVWSKYHAPFLTVIYNNRGWKSPKLSTLGVHPDGVANETNEFFVDFDPPADLAKIAESAGGAYARTVKNPSEVKDALRKAIAAVKEGRSAVLDVYLPAINKEKKKLWSLLIPQIKFWC